MNRRGGQVGNPGREGLISGQTKIRAYNTQRGKSAMVITLPTEVAVAFGWQPGMYLTYYPTKARELVFVRQDQLMVHVSPDYDLSLVKMGQALPPPKPGSLAEMEAKSDASIEEMGEKLRSSRRAAAVAEMEAKADGEVDDHGPLGMTVEAMIKSLGPEPEPKKGKGKK